MKNVIVVGGGLVGSLNACFLAKRGYKVDVYESRGDIRLQETIAGRSINLALSHRGLQALKHVNLDEMMKDKGIPMYGRMIHDLEGRRRFIPYGQKHQYIMSVDRAYLNKILLTAAEEYPGLNVHFDHKCLSCNFDVGEVTFSRTDGSLVTASGDLILGCDGAHSTVRKAMMKAVRLDYSQIYIPHGYMELNIPAKADNSFAMEMNSLHIWPRNEFMMIALPNVEDHSFVVTLFLPFDIFNNIKSNKELMIFFEENFPDAIPLIGRQNIIDTYFSSTASSLITVKCKPYHVNNKAVLMGDAGHAMVPFYGQGMNCGFEDCLVFDSIMEQYDGDFEKVLAEYTKYRGPDAHAICDLAMSNYVEMRASVNTWSFLMRKKLDNLLHVIMPRFWLPLYSSVSFTSTRYKNCVENRRWQDKVLRRIAFFSFLGLTVAGVGMYQQLNNTELFGHIENVLRNNPIAKKLITYVR